MKKFEEKTISTENIFQGRIIQLDVDTVSLPNGHTSKRELVRHPGAVAVIALTKEGKLLLVEQYRKPLEKSIVEIPAGKLEEGEKPEVTARRELEEETGYTTDELTWVNSFYTSPGFADELVHIYFTDNIRLLKEEIGTDEDEFVELLELTLEETEQLEKDQRVHDVKTSYALLFLKLKNMNI